MLLSGRRTIEVPWWLVGLAPPLSFLVLVLAVPKGLMASAMKVFPDGFSGFIPQVFGGLLLLIAFPKALPLACLNLRSEIGLTRLTAREFLGPRLRHILAPWGAFYAGFILCVIISFVSEKSDTDSPSILIVLGPLIGLFGFVEGLRIACRAKPPKRAYWLTVPLSLLTFGFHSIMTLADRLILPPTQLRIVNGGIFEWDKDNAEEWARAVILVHLQLPAIVILLFGFLLWCSWRSLFRNYFKFE